MIEIFLLISLLFLFGTESLIMFFILMFIIIMWFLRRVVFGNYSFVRDLGYFDVISWLLVMMRLILVLLTRSSMRNYFI